MIETERLILRPFEDKDLEGMYDYLKNININCFMEMKVADIEGAKEALVQRKGTDLYLSIVLKGTDDIIGEIFCDSMTTNEFGGVKDTYSLCWILNEKYQHKGYMTEAAFAYVDYLFKNTIARRIFAYTEDYNIACQKVLERLGFRKEGFYKEFVSFVNDLEGNPVYENTLEYAILKKEWKL